MNDTVELLSRLQFASTALYHFIFVPLTLGLSFLLAIMETTYLVTKNEIYKKMVRFWGVLFGINFAMGVATGLTMEFQFGTNWSYYSYYVGDIFGVPLAIEGLMAFFLESTFVGLFFLGWKKLTPKQHCVATWLMAIGTNLSALWILVANGWMQHPVGSVFNTDTMRMELTNFWDVFINQEAQTKFAHVVAGGYVAGAAFIIAISAFYLLKNRSRELAIRSIAIASMFGLVAMIFNAVAGDTAGYVVGEHQPIKVAAMEGVWNDTEAPAPANVFIVSSQSEHKNTVSLTVPYLGGLLVHHSLTRPIKGLNTFRDENRERIKNGQIAWKAFQDVHKGIDKEANLALFKEHQNDFGYGLLLKKYNPQIDEATPEQIEQAVEDSIPNVTVLFTTFHLMVAIGAYFILFMAYWVFKAYRGTIATVPKCILLLSILSLPLPIIAAQLGWVVAEMGRQPWVIQDILPTSVSHSDLTMASVLISLLGFVALYTIMLVVELILMVRTVKTGEKVVE